MPQNKEHNKLELDRKAIEKGFHKVAEDISMLKDVLAKSLDEINRIKGFQYVVAQILDECEICTKEELYKMAAEKYSSKLAQDLRQFLDLNLPSLSEKFKNVKVDKVTDSYESLESLLEQFTETYFDEEGKPKAKA